MASAIQQVGYFYIYSKEKFKLPWKKIFVRCFCASFFYITFSFSLMLANGHWCYCNNGKQGRSCHNLDDQPLDTKACSESTCLNGGKCLAFRFLYNAF